MIPKYTDDSKTGIFRLFCIHIGIFGIIKRYVFDGMGAKVRNGYTKSYRIVTAQNLLIFPN